MTSSDDRFIAGRRFRLASRAFLMSLAFLLLVAGNASGAEPDDKRQLAMETHAAFFSTETNQTKPVDPQVFVRDPAAAAGVGPQGIEHVAGFRPALIADPPQSELFNAKGHPLGFTLGEWLGAKGTVDIAPDGRNVTIRVSSLRPKATYSLFENHFDQRPIGFTPLDGTGSRNSFVAQPDGKATITVKTPQRLTRANAVLLVYHSDGEAHGTSRGDIGVNAHHQLIARIKGD